MSAPRVTVQMMVYNAARYLRASIDSILNQTFSDFELLIVDDASTDTSPDILRAYQDSRIRVIRNPTRRGVAPCRNQALDLATGGYIAVLDSDDFAMKNRLQAQVEYLDQHPDVDVVGSAYALIDPDGAIGRTIRVPTDSLEIRWKLLFGNCIGHSTVLYRRVRALALGGYDEQVFAGEDYDLWVRFAADGKIVQLDSPLTWWRYHTASLQQTEPITVKDHFIWTVIKSLQSQVGVTIGFDVARCLFRDLPKPAANSDDLRQAYATIADCLNRFLERSDATATDKPGLRTLALEEIFRVALENPGSYREATRAAWRCIDKRDGLGVFNRRIARLALLAALPRRVTDALIKMRRR